MQILVLHRRGKSYEGIHSVLLAKCFNPEMTLDERNGSIVLERSQCEIKRKAGWRSGQNFQALQA